MPADASAEERQKVLGQMPEITRRQRKMERSALRMNLRPSAEINVEIDQKRRLCRAEPASVSFHLENHTYDLNSLILSLGSRLVLLNGRPQQACAQRIKDQNQPHLQKDKTTPAAYASTSTDDDPEPGAPSSLEILQ